MTPALAPEQRKAPTFLNHFYPPFQMPWIFFLICVLGCIRHMAFLGTQIPSLPSRHVLCVTWGLTLAVCCICLGLASGRRLQGSQKKERNQGTSLGLGRCLWKLLLVFYGSNSHLKSPLKFQLPQVSPEVSSCVTCHSAASSLLQICNRSHRRDLAASQLSAM